MPVRLARMKWNWVEGVCCFDAGVARGAVVSLEMVE